jgi:hypothetical protein
MCPTSYRRDENNLIALMEWCISGYIAMIYGTCRSFHDGLQARITDEE